MSVTLLTIAQAAAFLGFKTDDAARNLLTELGVKPIPLGLGRARGHRYYQHEILAALESRRDATPKKPSRKPKPAALDAMSYYAANSREAKAMLTGQGRKQ